MATVTFFPCGHNLEFDENSPEAYEYLPDDYVGDYSAIRRHNGICPLCRKALASSIATHGYRVRWFPDDHPQKHTLLFLGRVTHFNAARGFGFLTSLGIDGRWGGARSYYFHGTNVWYPELTTTNPPIEFVRRGHDWVQPFLREGELVCFRVAPFPVYDGRHEEAIGIARAVEYQAVYRMLVARGDADLLKSEIRHILSGESREDAQFNHWVELQRFV